MPHWRSMTERATLGAWDLVDKDGAPKDWTLEIQSVRADVVKSREKPKGEKRPFITFRGASKPLVCNATNAKTIANLAGSDNTDKWIGLKISLYATQVQAANGEKVAGIRVRPVRAAAPAEAMGDGQPVNESMRADQRAASEGSK